MKIRYPYFTMEAFSALMDQHDRVVAQIKHSVNFLESLEAQKKREMGELKKATTQDERYRHLRNFIRTVFDIGDEKADLDRLTYEEQSLSAQIKGSETFYADLMTRIEIGCSVAHWEVNKHCFFRGLKN